MARLHALGAAARFVDRTGQLAVVMNGTASGPMPSVLSPSLEHAIVSGCAATLAAIAFAALALFGHRLPPAVTALRHGPARLVTALRSLHDGVVTDSIAWLAAGAATIGIALAMLVARAAT